MFADKLSTPEDYLSYFKQKIPEEKFARFPLVKAYYQELKMRFSEIFYGKEQNLFAQMAMLLDIDAQLQMIIQLFFYGDSTLFGLSEKKIIAMIQNDRKYYYRELTGIKFTEPSTWGMIYLSEEI